MQERIFIGLGSNEGDRMDHLQQAVYALFEQAGPVVAISPVYETPAWGYDGQDYLNAVVEVRTSLEPYDLLQLMHSIEAADGRTRKTKNYEDRPIDLDILYYGDRILTQQDVEIPHPRINGRKFVLQPLADVAGDFISPPDSYRDQRKQINELLNETEDTTDIKRWHEILKPHPLLEQLAAHRFIAIEGNIGAGKTTLATKIAEEFNGKLILERFSDNPFLPKFYEDQKRYAFPTELSFLADRYQQLADDVGQYDMFKDFKVSDYYVFKSLIFAKITLQEDEFALYEKLFYMMYKELAKPDLYVYLHQNTERLLENIKKRGREYEQSIEAEYLEKLNDGYASFIKTERNLEVRVVDVSALDFVSSRADYINILKQIIE